MDTKQDLGNLTSSEPEPEATVTMTSQKAVGEPLPEWYSAIPTWGPAWHFYQYGFGGMFAVLTLSAVIFLLRALHHNRAARPKKAALMVLTLLFLFGLSRSLYLTVDAHNTKWILPKTLLNIMWSLGSPCIITAYALIFFVLKNTFFLKERFHRWYTARNLAFVTAPYFALVFVSELVVLYIPRFHGLTFTCQMLNVVLSLMLSTFYSFIAYLLWKSYRGKSIPKRKESRQQQAWVDTNKIRKHRTFSLLKICIAAVIGGLFLCGLQIYSMSGVYGVFSTAHYVEAWPWLIFNYAMRVLELFLAIVLYVASTRGRQNCGTHQASFSVSLAEFPNVSDESRRTSRIFSLMRASSNAVADVVYSRKSTVI